MEITITLIITVVVAAVILGTGWLIYSGNQSSDEELRKRIETCVTHGGSWVQPYGQCLRLKEGAS